MTHSSPADPAEHLLHRVPSMLGPTLPILLVTVPFIVAVVVILMAMVSPFRGRARMAVPAQPGMSAAPSPATQTYIAPIIASSAPRTAAVGELRVDPMIEDLRSPPQLMASRSPQQPRIERAFAKGSVEYPITRLPPPDKFRDAPATSELHQNTAIETDLDQVFAKFDN